jgi:predicted molibdopterin-dependent oxidoreductase YjgC
MLNLNRLFGLGSKGQMAALARYANSRGAEKLGLMAQPQSNLVQKIKTLWGEFPDCAPNNTDAMMAQIKKEEIKGYIIIGANPMMLYPDREFVREGLEKLEFLVACDLFETATTELADVVLPLASWAEYDGHYVNLEGRSQRASQAVKTIGEAKPGYEIAQLIARSMDVAWFEDDDELHGQVREILDLDTVLPLPDEFMEIRPLPDDDKTDHGIPLFIVDDSHHSGHLTEKAPSLANFASEPYIELSSEMAAKHKIAEGDSVRVESEIGKVLLPARISECLDNGVALVPRNFTSKSVTSIMMRKRRVDLVKISKVDE